MPQSSAELLGPLAISGCALCDRLAERLCCLLQETSETEVAQRHLWHYNKGDAAAGTSCLLQAPQASTVALAVYGRQLFTARSTHSLDKLV